MLQKYSFDLFLQRCKALGNNKFTQVKLIIIIGIYGKSQENPQGRRQLEQWTKQRTKRSGEHESWSLES